MERYKLKTCLLSDEDLRVVMESLWHSHQRADVPFEDKKRIRELRTRFGEKFKGEESGSDLPDTGEGGR